MIRIEVGKSGKVYNISLSGHAGYGASGFDIVCAGASALFFALGAELEALAAEGDGECRILGAEMSKGEGRISLRMPNDHCRAAGAVEMFVRGAAAMERQYGRYICVLAPCALK